MFIPWVQVNTLSPMEQIQFHIGIFATSQWIKSNFTLKQIQFYNGKTPMTHWNKFNLTLKKIQFHFETNPISHWKTPIPHWKNFELWVTFLLWVTFEFFIDSPQMWRGAGQAQFLLDILTCDMRHMTFDMWQLTSGGRWRLSPSSYRDRDRKRSRARVTIEGQCFLLQISLQIKCLIFC